MALEDKCKEYRIEKLGYNKYQLCKSKSEGGFHKDGIKKDIRGLYDFITQAGNNLGYTPRIHFATPEIEKDLESRALVIKAKSNQSKAASGPLLY
jgi:hypothetical protein